MDYLVELYDRGGRKTYNYRAVSAQSALEQLSSIMKSPELYPFVNASCYLHRMQVWNLEQV